MEQLRQLLDQLLSPGTVIATVTGVLLTHAWARYRRSMSVIRWRAEANRLGGTSTDEFFGKVEVRHNESVVQNVFAIVVHLENSSSNDLTDLDIALQLNGDGAKILNARGGVVGSARTLDFTDRFMREVAKVTDASVSEATRAPVLAVIQGLREFRVPVLNRLGAATIQCLAECSTSTPPTVDLKCDRVGVRLLQDAAQVRFWGVGLGQAALAGAVVGLVLVVAGSVFSVWSLASALAGFMLGTFAGGIGFVAVRLWRSIAYFFR